MKILSRAKVYCLFSMFQAIGGNSDADMKWCEKQVNKMKKRQVIACIQQTAKHRKDSAKYREEMKNRKFI